MFSWQQHCSRLVPSSVTQINGPNLSFIIVFVFFKIYIKNLLYIFLSFGSNKEYVDKLIKEKCCQKF